MIASTDLDAQLEELWRRSNLTAAQALVWLHQKRHAALPTQHVALLWFIPAEIDAAGFEAAFQRVVDGCDALRTIVEEQARLPQQRVLPEVRASFEVVGLEQTPNPMEAAKTWAVQRAQAPFKLAERLFDSALLKLGENRFAWFLNQHRIIADGWSALLIFRRVAEAYRASLDATLEALPPPPLFADFVTAERQLGGTPKHQKTRLYWQTKLAAAPAPLPLAEGGAAELAARRAHLSRFIGVARSQRLREIIAGPEFAGAFQNLGMFSLFTGFLLTCLFHRTGQQRMALGIPASGRTSRKLEDTAGLCTHMVVEHFEVAPDESILAGARKVRGEMVEVLRQQNFVASTLPPRRLYDAAINFCHGKAGRFLGWPVQTEFIDSGSQDDSQEKIAFQVRDYDATGGFVLDFDFRLDAFDEAQQQEFIRHFFGIMDAFLADPAQPVRGLCPTAPAEIREFTVEETEVERAPTPESNSAPELCSRPPEPYVAPRTPTEETVARFWREVLSLETVGVDDDFFALGGHSMQAVRLFSAIEEAFGINLPLSTLLDHPTIAKLSAHLDVTDRTAEWPSVVRIREGAHKMPLFCTHGLGGDILGFRNLAPYLDPQRPLYGLRARGLDGKSPPKVRIEDMAAAYIEEMREVQPVGPYSIIGFSFGGLIAYEVGRQMMAQGQKMHLVGLLDTRKLLSPKTFLLNVMLVSLKDKVSFIRAAMGARAHGGALTRSRLSALSSSAGAPSLRPDRIRAVRQGSIKAANQYVVPAYEGRLTFFRTKALLAPSVLARLHHPWSDLCRGGVDIHDLPCDHWSILLEPHVQILAAIIEDYTRQVDP